MNDASVRRRSIESLKKEAKRWLAALRDNDDTARTRFVQALISVPKNPTLRDVQHALARENGYAGWTELTAAIARDRQAGTESLAHYEAAAAALLNAYRTGTRDALERHYRYTWHRRSWPAMRTYVQLDLGKSPADPNADVDITLDDARRLVALDFGFESWDELVEFTSTLRSGRTTTARPVRAFGSDRSDGERTLGESREWNTILEILASQLEAGLDAAGQMTDAMLRDVCAIESVVALRLENSPALTDDGIAELARLPHLRSLHLDQTPITDRGLEVCRRLSELETISLSWTRITDAGVSRLKDCEKLRNVNLMGTVTGDGAIRALAGKGLLSHFNSGNGVTDGGLALLHDMPVFKTWRGGEAAMGILSYKAEPNQLMLRGSFTDAGMQSLRGLDGLFALNIDASEIRITAAALAPLITLPNLGWLAVDAKDDWMPLIAEMPRLRFLAVQDTATGDDGFVSLSKSRSIEYIWGRRCHNLLNRGFAALADMPRLRGLSVSCLNVDDAAVSLLPTFPALRELMPMDIPDSGYQHIGRCTQLESLVLMYCRNTTDLATEQITGLHNLRTYFNSYTTITDRTPELLSGMDTLEKITFNSCPNVTNKGIAKLARLPALREVRVSGERITEDIVTAFPSGVRVFYSL
jgi:hypothetical protein